MLIVNKSIKVLVSSLKGKTHVIVYIQPALTSNLIATKDENPDSYKHVVGNSYQVFYRHCIKHL